MDSWKKQFIELDIGSLVPFLCLSLVCWNIWRLYFSTPLKRRPWRWMNLSIFGYSVTLSYDVTLTKYKLQISENRDLR